MEMGVMFTTLQDAGKHPRQMRCIKIALSFEAQVAKVSFSAVFQLPLHQGNAS